MAKKTDYYLLIVWKDVQPELFGAYKTAAERDAVAKLKYREQGDDNGYFKLSVPKGTSVQIGAFSRSEMEKG
jgi:hypothetical protein